MCEYTGQYRSKIESIVEKNGGKLHFDVTFLRRDKIASGYFFLENGNLRLSAEGSLFPSLTEMYITLHECGYGVNDSDGANTSGGNAANCVSGNFSMRGNIVTELKSTLSELLGIDEPTERVKAPKAPKIKEPRMLKADKRVMRPEGAMKGENVWCPEYVKNNQIDESRCYELWGGKNDFYTAMKTMTVFEFETTYGLRTK